MDFNNSPGKQGSFRRDDTPHDRAAFQTKQKKQRNKTSIHGYLHS